MNLKNFLLYNRYDTTTEHHATPQKEYDEMVTLFNKHNLNYEDLNSD